MALAVDPWRACVHLMGPPVGMSGVHVRLCVLCVVARGVSVPWGMGNNPCGWLMGIGLLFVAL